MSGILSRPVHTGESGLQLQGFQKFQLVSLLELVKVLSRGYIQQLEVVEMSVLNGVDDRRDFEIPDNETLNADHVSKIDKKLELQRQLYVYLKFPSPLQDYLKRIRKKITSSMTFGELRRELEFLNDLVEDAMAHIVFGFVPLNRKRYFKQEQMFGQKVFDSFPSARPEIKEAGNCYAHGLNTACVFHLMRAVEIAVKAMHWTLTRRKKLVYEKFKAGVKQPLSKPIELCDWGQLISGLNLLLTKLAVGKSGSVLRQQKHAFYSDVIRNFEHFKDAWRNTISHGHEIGMESKRLLFMDEEAQNIMTDTERFLKKLAERVKE